MNQDLYVEKHGAGIPLVLLHGWGMHAGVWRPLLPELMQDYCVYLIDLPGYGRSALPEDVKTPQEYIEYSVKQLKQAEIAPAHWLGWSMGGMLATAFAREASARVFSLVYLCSTPRFTASDTWPYGIPVSTLNQFGEQLTSDHATTLNRFISLQVQGSSNASESLRALRRVGLSDPLPQLHALELGLELLKEVDMRNAWSELPVPACALFGENDRIVQAKTLRGLTSINPSIQTHEIAGAGHIPFITHAKVVLAHIKSFHDQFVGARHEAG